MIQEREGQSTHQSSRRRRRSPAILGAMWGTLVLGGGVRADSGEAPKTSALWTEPAFSLAPEDLLAAANLVSREGDAGVLVLLREIRYSYDVQGRRTHYERFGYRIESTAGSSPMVAACAGLSWSVLSEPLSGSSATCRGMCPVGQRYASP